MKRSKFTNYSYDETIIYEYMKKYYIMELCQQGELNPAHDNRQAPSDVCDLSSTYDSNTAAEKIGKGIIKALDNFDSRAHPYDKFDLPARGRYISGLVGARGLPSLERDSRQVVVKRQLEAQQRSNLKAGFTSFSPIYRLSQYRLPFPLFKNFLPSGELPLNLAPPLHKQPAPCALS